MRLVIVRHADPEYSVDGLTESGHLEAKALAERFGSGYDGSIAKIYTSPKGRARATAKYTEDILGMEAAVEDWTQELSYWGRLDQNARPGEGGMALWDMPGEFIRSFEPPLTIESQWEELEDLGKVRKNYVELCSMSDAFLARHGYVRENGRYRVERRNEDVIVVFCHGGFGLTWLSHLLQLPAPCVWSNFWMAPSSVTTVLFDIRSPEYATPRCLAVGDLSHLHKAGLTTVISKYEKPNSYGDYKRPSAIKANFW
ncbi:hypothetical protein NDN08_004313 [Rhodosorus marinus]|uniref:Histidine phosphatase family protein n=1 Tax=Rhodosorus marinus TaxID=101924 RepID=A0AAV8UQ45_9RHOD|nr:hypothetical protein NDN08_004313 [Rhodosorus marinus]